MRQHLKTLKHTPQGTLCQFVFILILLLPHNHIRTVLTFSMFPT